MLNSWVWMVRDIKPWQNKSNLFLFIITNWWMHLFVFWSKQESWRVTLLFWKKFALSGFCFLFSSLFFLKHPYNFSCFLRHLLGYFCVSKWETWRKWWIELKPPLTGIPAVTCPFSCLQFSSGRKGCSSGCVALFSLVCPLTPAWAFTFHTAHQLSSCASFLTTHFPAGDR